YGYQTVYGVDPLTGAYYGTPPLYAGLVQLPPGQSYEYAGFGNLTYRFTDSFDLQVGVRETHNHSEYHEIDSGPIFGGPTPIYTNPGPQDSNAFTYLVTPRYKVSEHLMVYGRVASGFRPGGANGNCVLDQVPCTIKPDVSTTYEIGSKGELF